MPPQPYNHEETERALWTLALNGGRYEATAEQVGIPKQTLWRWANSVHAERYEQIRNEASEKIAQRVAADAEATMLMAGDLERDLLARMQHSLAAGEIKPSDYSNALR